MNHKEIIDLRQRLGVSMEKFGKILHVSHATVSKWESGETEPRYAFQRMLNQLKTAVDEQEKNEAHRWEEVQKEDYNLAKYGFHYWPKVEEARQALKLSKEDFLKELGVDDLEYFAWMEQRKSIPHKHKKLLVKLMEEKFGPRPY